MSRLPDGRLTPRSRGAALLFGILQSLGSIDPGVLVGQQQRQKVPTDASHKAVAAHWEDALGVRLTANVNNALGPWGCRDRCYGVDRFAAPCDGDAILRTHPFPEDTVSSVGPQQLANTGAATRPMRRPFKIA